MDAPLFNGQAEIVDSYERAKSNREIVNMHSGSVHSSNSTPLECKKQ